MSQKDPPKNRRDLSRRAELESELPVGSVKLVQI